MGHIIFEPVASGSGDQLKPFINKDYFSVVLGVKLKGYALTVLPRVALGNTYV